MNLSNPLPSEPLERRTVLFSSILLFSITAALVILKSARDALFLNQYSARLLPYFLFVNVLYNAGFAGMLLRSGKRSTGAALRLWIKVFLIGTLLIWPGVIYNWKGAAPLLFFWVGSFAAIAPVQAWLLINQTLLTRQAKKYLGLIGSGAILGAIVAGLLTSSAGAVRISLLFPIAAVIMLPAFGSISKIASATALVGEPEPEKTSVRRRFITLVLLIVATGTLVSTFADFQFKVTVQKHYSSAEAMAQFFGLFYSLAGIAALCFQLLLTTALISRIGATAGLALLPVALAAGNLWMMLAGTLGAAVFLKGSEQLLKHSLDRSSLEILYTLIPQAARVRIKPWVDILCVRGMEVFATGLLIVLFSIAGVSLRVLAVLSLGLVVLSSFWIFLITREYPEVLRSAIKQTEINFSKIRASFFTTGFYSILPELLQSNDRQKLLDLLQLLQNSGIKRGLHPHLIPLLKHPDADVRLRALELLFVQQENASGEIVDLIHDPEERVRLESIRYLGLRSRDEVVPLLRNLLSDPSFEVRKTALRSFAVIQPPELLDDLIQMADQTALRNDLRAAIGSYGSAAVAHLERRLRNEPLPVEAKKFAVQVLGDTAVHEAVPVLLNQALAQDMGISYLAIKSLNWLKKKGVSDMPVESLNQLLNQETDRLQSERERLALFPAGSEGLAPAVLRQRKNRSQERVFRVLGLLYDQKAIHHAYRSLVEGNKRRADAALEFLDTTLGPAHRRRVLDLLEPGNLPVSGNSNAKDILLLLLQAHDELSASALLSEMTDEELISCKDQVLHAIREADPAVPLVEETFRWRASMIEPAEKAQEKISTLQRLQELRKTNLFSMMGPQELLIFARRAVTVQCRAGQIIYQSGATSGELYCLVSGKVEIRPDSGVSTYVDAGETFGIISALAEQGRPASAIAAADCVCLKIDSWTFWEVLDDYPAIARSLFKLLAGRTNRNWS